MSDKGSLYLPPTYLWDNYFSPSTDIDSQKEVKSLEEARRLFDRYPGLLEIRTRMTYEQFSSQVREKNPELYEIIMKEELVWKDVWRSLRDNHSDKSL